MGRSFKAPKRSDVDHWRAIEALWISGFRFYSYRSAPDAESMPTKSRDVAGFVRRNPNHPFRTGALRR
jgi:hypothetical protein